MDVYLPADFYRLRDNLHDWRDAPAADPEQWLAPRENCTAIHAVSDACADPLWRVF
ncbi:MAG: hypothetical protein P4L92_06545 [Rudaea sp.]|nr:hypothetical protein [Rudaea sp.]